MDKMQVVITADAEVIPAKASDVESTQEGDDE